MHVQDNLSEAALKAVMEEKSIKEVLDMIHKVNILIHGIGIAEVMATRRGIPSEEIAYIEEKKL